MDEEQEYIPVAGLKSARNTEQSVEGKKKFETLLKAKSTQTRGNPLLSCLLCTRTKMAIARERSPVDAPYRRASNDKG